MQSLRHTYFDRTTRTPTSHYQKNRPAVITTAGVLLTENGDRLLTESGEALALNERQRAAWLPTINDVKDALRIPRDDTSEDNYIDEVLDEALAVVEAECGIDVNDTNYIAVLDADDFEFEKVKIDRNEVSEVSSVEAIDSDGEKTQLEFEVHWQNGVVYVALLNDEMYPANRKIQIEYSRGMASSSPLARLFKAAVKHTAKSFYEMPGRVADKTMPRGPIYNALHNALRDKRSTSKWTK